MNLEGFFMSDCKVGNITPLPYANAIVPKDVKKPSRVEVVEMQQNLLWSKT